MKTIALTMIDEYQDEDVLSRFTDMYDVGQEEALDIFKETKKFLSISLKKGVFISDDLLIIDAMWHNFILFTSKYEQFCMQCFDNRFLHHLPASKKEKEDQRLMLEKDPELARQEYLNKLEKMMSIVYDELGPETVVKWFQQYPEKYSKEHIKSIRK